MQAHVKTPHIKIDIKGDIHPKILSVLKEVYGTKVKFVKDSEDEVVDVFSSDWFNKLNSQLTPGNNMKMYRENMKLTQEELGVKLGSVSKQNVSHMERGIRPISIKNAKMLAEIFAVPVDRFI